MLSGAVGVAGMKQRRWVGVEMINTLVDAHSLNLTIGLMILSFIHSRRDVIQHSYITIYINYNTPTRDIYL